MKNNPTRNHLGDLLSLLRDTSPARPPYTPEELRALLRESDKRRAGILPYRISLGRKIVMMVLTTSVIAGTMPTSITPPQQPQRNGAMATELSLRVASTGLPAAGIAPPPHHALLSPTPGMPGRHKRIERHLKHPDEAHMPRHGQKAATTAEEPAYARLNLRSTQDTGMQSHDALLPRDQPVSADQAGRSGIQSAIEAVQPHQHTGTAITCSYLLHTPRTITIALHDTNGRYLCQLAGPAAHKVGRYDVRADLAEMEGGLYNVVIRTDQEEQIVQQILVP